MALSTAEGAEVKLAKGKLLSPPAMQVTHQAFQALLDHMGVDLRGRDIGMAKQCLHDTQIGAVMQQVARERMPHHMRTDQPGCQPAAAASSFRSRANAAASNVRSRRTRETAISSSAFFLFAGFRASLAAR